eukprot:1145028-Pelagomonas_calceolata.AAC.1
MKRVPRTNSRYPLRSRGGCGGNREHSAPATATLPAFKVRHPIQLLPEHTSILWRSNTVKTPGPRINWRPQSSSVATPVIIFQGPQITLHTIC